MKIETAAAKKDKYHRISDNRAVSESIGSVLVFGIVITGIALIVLSGMNILNDTKDLNNFQNVEQGFKVVQSDLKRVALEKTPVMTARMHLEGGALYTNVTGYPFQVDFNGNTYRNTTGAISYLGSNGKSLSVQNGGVWLAYAASDLNDQMVLPPRIFAQPDTGTLVINVIRLTGSPSSFGGSGTMNIVMEYNDTAVYTYSSPTPADAVITINTGYPNAWGRCLESSLEAFSASTQIPSPDTAVVTVHGISQVIVSEHTVQVQPLVYNS